MKKQSLHHVRSKIAPYILFPAMIGVLTGVLIFLFKIASSWVMKQSANMYTFVRENPKYLPLLVLGIAALVCGLLGIYDALVKAKEKSRSLAALPEAEALEEAAWDVFTGRAPKKEDMNDLTYIPVNEKTRARKNGDLMILYGLLPEIAVEAWKRLHKGDEKDDPAHCNVQDQG